MSSEVPSEYTIEVAWDGGMRYRGGRSGGGPTLTVDGRNEVAPSPVDAMLVSLAACSAIDVVEILEKRRTPPRELNISVDFSRAAEHPRRITRAHLIFTMTTDSERAHVERAIALSFEKYCSVASTFAPDTRMSWELKLSST